MTIRCMTGGRGETVVSATGLGGDGASSSTRRGALRPQLTILSCRIRREARFRGETVRRLSAKELAKTHRCGRDDVDGMNYSGIIIAAGLLAYLGGLKPPRALLHGRGRQPTMLKSASRRRGVLRVKPGAAQPKGHAACLHAGTSAGVALRYPGLLAKEILLQEKGSIMRSERLTRARQWQGLSAKIAIIARHRPIVIFAQKNKVEGRGTSWLFLPRPQGTMAS
ncbi:hypothetical protein BJX62DRAFT_220035 [Aspergillus germanicus]